MLAMVFATFPITSAITLVVSMVAIYLWNYTHWTRRKIRQGFQIPILGDHSKHFFGIAPYQEVLQSIYNKFPNARYCGFYQYLQPGLLIRDPALIKSILMNNVESFLDRTPFLAETDDELWKKNLFSLRGDRWRDMRNILTPAFSSSKMKQMFGSILSDAQRFHNTLEKRDGNVLELEFRDISTRFTNDIIASIAFGIQIDSLRNPENEFFMKGTANINSDNYMKLFKMKLSLLWPGFGKILKTNMFDPNISNFFRDTITDTITQRRSSGSQRNDMIQLLMRANERDPDAHGTLEDDDIASQAIIFFLGGFETVSSSVCFMAYELALNQDIQDRLREEIDKCGELHPEIAYEDICQLTYLDMVLAEVLRKWPPILNLDRLCTQPHTIQAVEDNEIDVKIDVNDLIWLPVWCIHHDPKYWPEPDRFNPERFSEDHRPPPNDPTYIPFGLGGRNCIGHRFAQAQVKAFFYELLRRFKIVIIPKSTVPFVPATHTFNLASKYGFWLGLEKRNEDVKKEENASAGASSDGTDKDQNEDSKEDKQKHQNGDSEKDIDEHQTVENENGDNEENNDREGNVCGKKDNIRNNDKDPEIENKEKDKDKKIESQRNNEKNEMVDNDSNGVSKDNREKEENIDKNKTDKNEAKKIESESINAKDEKFNGNKKDIDKDQMKSRSNNEKDQSVDSNRKNKNEDQQIDGKKNMEKTVDNKKEDENKEQIVESKKSNEKDKNSESKQNKDKDKNVDSNKKDKNEDQNVENKKDNEEKGSGKKSSRKSNKKR